MKKSLMVAAFLAASGGAVGLSAGTGVGLLGSDTLFDFTNAMITACSGAAGATYKGTGSGNGEKAMTAGTQQIAPMSRFMNKNACTGTAASPTTSQGIVIGLDGVSIVGSKSTFANTTCNGDDNSACDPTFEATTGIAYNVADPVTGYAFADWRDVLRVLFAGFDNTNNGTGAANLQNRDCNSAERQSLANNYGRMFENNCAAGTVGDACGTTATPTAGPCTQIKHIFRRDDFSGTTDTIVSLLNLPSTVTPETTVTVFPGGTSTSITQHTGMNAFCNSVRPAFALPGADGVNAQSATNPQVTCLQGSDSTWDPTDSSLGTGCTKENAVYRSTMQDNDPIRRTCCGSGTGAVGTVAEDNCSHSGDLGLLLAMNDMPEAGDNGTTSDPLRYNATPCVRKFTTVGPPEIYDAVTQGQIICLRGALCPNGDKCTSTGACFVPTDNNGNVQCLATKLTAPATVIRNVAVPVINPKAPGLAEGRAYNQHLFKQAGTGGVPGYQLNGFGAGLKMTGAFYRIHTNHSANPGSTTTSPITCQFADNTDQIGCLVSASPCSIGYAGRSAVDHNPNTSPLKVKAQDPDLTCIQNNFAYPLSRKLYLDSVPGFAAVTGAEQALAQCETNLAPAGIELTALTNAGFVPLTLNGGQPYCEDFNENMLCGPSPTTPTFPTNSASCPTAVPAGYTAFPVAPTSPPTTCGDGNQDPYEDCDCGTAQIGTGGLTPASNVTLCAGTINGGTVCGTTCRTVH